jgi:hypothetical protein
MLKTVASQISSRLVAIENCEKSNNQEWKLRHAEEIKKLVDSLPHGSGIDGKTELDFSRSTPEKLVLTGSYHSMNDGGYYDGWTDFTLTVTPSLAYGFNLKVSGAFPRRYAETREYLAEVFQEALGTEV